MYILLTNHQMYAYTGTELYTYTLALALKNLGHKICVYTKFPGEISEKLEEMGIHCTNDLESIKDEPFEVAHVHHVMCAYEIRIKFPQIPIVFQSHGAKTILEQPPKLNINISRFLAISEMVRENVKKTNYIDDVQIIGNGFDTQSFRQIKPINPKPQNALVISNKMTLPKKNILMKALQKLGINCVFVGAENAVAYHRLPKYINEADIVFTIGRGVVESLLCERAVFVFDSHAADGIVTSSNYDSIKITHFSGQAFNKVFNSSQIIKEINTYYNPEDVAKLSLRVQKEFNIDATAKKLLAIYEDVAKIPVEKISEEKIEILNQILDLVEVENMYVAKELKGIKESRLYDVWKKYSILKKLAKLQKR